MNIFYKYMEKILKKGSRALLPFNFKYMYLIYLSLRITSCAPPSTIEVDDTSVIFALLWNCGMVIEPQLHIVEMILPKVTSRLSFIFPAYGT